MLMTDSYKDMSNYKKLKINKSLMEYSDERPLKEVIAVVIHYTANPDTNAENNAKYLRSKGLGYHFIIDIDGTIYQLQNLKKRAIHCGGRKYTPDATKFFGEKQAPSYYHTAENQHNGSPNNLTIGVCFCYKKESGKPEDIAYEALCELLAFLLRKYNLGYKGGIWRHYDVTGKKCPLYFVNNTVFVKLLHDTVNKMQELIGVQR